MGRALHNNEWVPGKAHLHEKACYVTSDGREFIYNDFEVLLNSPKFSWVKSNEAEVSSRAVVGGTTSSGEFLYIGEVFPEVLHKNFDFNYQGRAKYGEILIPGKVLPSNDCLYFLSDGIEYSTTNYQVLIRQRERGEEIEPQDWLSCYLKTLYCCFECFACLACCIRLCSHN